MAYWRKVTLPVPVLGNWDTMHSGNPKPTTVFEDLGKTKAQDDWLAECRKEAEMRQRTLAWIEDFIAHHPEGLVDNTFSLAKPKFDHLQKDDEQEFPALPPPKPAAPKPKHVSKQPTKSSTNNSESPTKKNSIPVQKNPAQGLGTANTGSTNQKTYASVANSSNNANANTNSTTPQSQPQTQPTAWDNNPWVVAAIKKNPAQEPKAVNPSHTNNNPWSNVSSSATSATTNATTPASQPQIKTTALSKNFWGRHLKPWTPDPTDPVLSTSPPKSLGGSADSSTDIAEQQAILNREILDTSHGDWKECRCDQCYDDNKTEYSKHMAECEDCRDAFFNHEMFDGRLREFWGRLEGKMVQGAEICKLCRWERDLGQHPFERTGTSSNGEGRWEVGKK
jgi:hypothetical protein